MGSNLVFKSLKDHEGEMRRSEDELSDIIWRGTS